MPTARNNILHGYANYTYNLQLWAVTPGGFNKISDGLNVGEEDGILQGGQLLISNGGVGNGETRSPFFPTDFVIDNLEIETVVGNKGKGARGTDAISLKFEIIEPYTVTLLDRLNRVAQNVAMGLDFKTLIYCLKIQFFGYDDMGKPVTIPATKWIPMSLLNMEFNVTHKGAVYSCQAIPSQNMALTLLDNTIPFHVELKGQTIKDMFSAQTITASSDAANSGKGSSRKDTAPIPYGSDSNVVKSIAGALNDNENYKVEQKAQKFPNVYRFVFDDELAKAVVLDPAKPNDNAIPMSNVKGSDGQTAKQQAVAGNLPLDNVNGTFRTQAGTKITDFINSIFQVTDFMKNQVNKAGGDKNKPFYGIKIIPKMKILQYDSFTKWFNREVTYVVKKFAYYGEDHPQMPQKAPDPAAVVKNYEYMFTGNNKDVAKVNLHYQMAFFEVRNANKDGYTQDANAGGPGGTGKSDVEGTAYPTNTELAKAGYITAMGIANQQNTGSNTRSVESMTVSEMMSKLFDNIADTISLDIEITGDPDWIQQDNLLYAANLPNNSKIASNGVINYQDSITHFQFTFKSPTKDYNDVSGLIDVNDSTTAIFSGLYHVISVTSSFRKGRFTQKLTNNRIRIQKDSETKPAVTAAAAPAADGRTPTPPAPVAAAPVAPTLPNISQNSLDANGKFIGIGGPTETPTFMTGA